MKQSSTTHQGIPISHHDQVYQNPASSCMEFHNRHSYILSTILMLLVIFSIILNVYDLITLLVFKPTTVQVSIDKATLTEFSLWHKKILSYNLALDISVSNPNKRIGIYYENLQAMAYYGGQRLAQASLPSFYQAELNVSMIHPVFSGRSRMDNSYVVASDFILQRAQGWFRIDVKVFAEVRLKLGPVDAASYSPALSCGLLVPLVSANSSEGTNFNWTKCDADFPSVGFLPQALHSSCHYIVPFTLCLLCFMVIHVLRFV